MSESWQQREQELVPPGTPLPEQIRRYALEVLNNPEGVRLLAWGGLEYAGQQTDPDHARRAQRLRRHADEIAAVQSAGRLPAELDPTCLTVMFMAAAMATTTLSQLIEGICARDSGSSEFAQHYADQLAKVARLLGLDHE